MTHPVFVLAAGRGTRLAPLTHCRPKPVVPVCGVPLLDYTIALCEQHGLTGVVVNAHHLPEQIQEWARDDVHVIVEEALLGTGGGLRNASHLLAERFIVLNGDVLHNLNLTDMLQAVPEGGATLAIRPDPINAPIYGIVAADDTDTIVQVRQITQAEPIGTVHRDTHFTGLHAMSRQMLERHGIDGPSCIIRTAYRDVVPTRLVTAVRYDGPWLDVGNPDTYLDANRAVLRGEVSLALDPHSTAGYARRADGSELGDPSLVAGCELHGAIWVDTQVPPGSVLTDTIIGRDAVFSGPCDLTDSVIWDGATVPSGQWSRLIAHDQGHLVPERTGVIDNAGEH